MRILVLGGAGYIGSHTVYGLSDGVCSTSFQAEKEMDILAKAIIEGKNIHDIEEINCQYYKNWKGNKLMPD